MYARVQCSTRVPARRGLRRLRADRCRFDEELRPGGLLLEVADAAEQLRPDDEVAWYRLSQAERAAGNKEAQQKALEAFRKLHSVTPGTLRKPNQDEEITPQQIDANP